MRNREACSACVDLVVEVGGGGQFVFVAKDLAQPRRQAPLLQRLGNAIALQRRDQPFRPFAVAVDVAIADEGVVDGKDVSAGSASPAICAIPVRADPEIISGRQPAVIA